MSDRVCYKYIKGVCLFIVLLILFLSIGWDIQTLNLEKQHLVDTYQLVGYKRLLDNKSDELEEKDRQIGVLHEQMDALHKALFTAPQYEDYNILKSMVDGMDKENEELRQKLKKLQSFWLP